ncbi:hypothetical protein [Sphingomonas radiodurans]|uniref:hypothetical protein n=1 Tax=Sphingomonas radiodurans TaxID=2890321 RepID=UPI001E30EA27|nr:hypothetical protein [Sphingomonas radiodurans]WBH16647.1 hypothetical protein LLW23_00525 [Sphingomonas radiodurans]
MAEENVKPKAAPSALTLEVRQKAKEAAAADGKDWAKLSKEDRLEIKKVIRAGIEKEDKRKARKAEKSDAD